MLRLAIPTVIALCLAAPAAAQTASPAPAPESPPPTVPRSSEPAPEPAPEAVPEPAPEPEGTMTLARLGEIIRKLDEAAQPVGGGRAWQFTIEGQTVMLVSDPGANRMRLMSPIKDASALDQAELLRLSQANFDTALDARYAVARGVLWSVFIHPLRALHDRQFVEAIGQTVNAARSYGTTFSSGLLSFGSGDSRTIIQRELIEKLLRQSGEDI